MLDDITGWYKNVFVICLLLSSILHTLHILQILQYYILGLKVKVLILL